MNNKKLLNTIYYILSLVCYVVAILFITKSNSTGMGIFWLLLGSANICFASLLNRKSKENEEENKGK